MVQGTNQDSVSWQSCHLWASRPGNNNTHLTGVNVSTDEVCETDDAREGFARLEGCNQCASLSFHGSPGEKAGHPHGSWRKASNTHGPPQFHLSRECGSASPASKVCLDSCEHGLLSYPMAFFMFFISAPASFLRLLVPSRQGASGCFSSMSPWKVTFFFVWSWSMLVCSCVSPCANITPWKGNVLVLVTYGCIKNSPPANLAT